MRVASYLFVLIKHYVRFVKEEINLCLWGTEYNGGGTKPVHFQCLIACCKRDKMYLRARIMELGADLQVLNDAPKKYVIVSTSLLLEQSCNVAISAEVHCVAT